MTTRRDLSPLLALLLTASCAASPKAGGYHPRSAATTASAPAPAPETNPTPQKDTPAAILTQYRRFHLVMEQALATDDPSSIRTVATGVVAEALEHSISDQQREGVVRRGHTALNPRAYLLDRPQPQALVSDCLFSSGLTTFRRDTGLRTGPPPHPLHERIHALLAKEDGTWKVSETNVPADSAC